MGQVQYRIIEKLNAAHTPESLDVIDESHKHKGHAGSSDAGETHFHVVIAASAFAGQNRVQRQRAIYKTLADELAGPVHALSIEFV